jgi:hypothetical protein
MSSNKVVLYFDKPEDAIRFTVAASSILSSDNPAAQIAMGEFAQQFSKVSRIRIEQEESPEAHPSAA